MVVIGSGEQQRGPFALEVGCEGPPVPVQLRRELGVVGLVEQFDRRQEIVRPALEVAPRREIGAEAVRFA